MQKRVFAVDRRTTNAYENDVPTRRHPSKSGNIQFKFQFYKYQGAANERGKSEYPLSRPRFPISPHFSLFYFLLWCQEGNKVEKNFEAVSQASSLKDGFRFSSAGLLCRPTWRRSSFSFFSELSVSFNVHPGVR